MLISSMVFSFKRLIFVPTLLCVSTCSAHVSFGLRAGAGASVFSVSPSFKFTQSYRAGYDGLMSMSGGACYGDVVYQGSTDRAPTTIEARDGNDFFAGDRQRDARADYLLFQTYPEQIHNGYTDANAGWVDLAENRRESWLFQDRADTAHLPVDEQRVDTSFGAIGSSLSPFVTLRGYARMRAMHRVFVEAWAEGRFGFRQKVDFGTVNFFVDHDATYQFSTTAAYPLQSFGYKAFGFKAFSSNLEVSVSDHFRLGGSVGVFLRPGLYCSGFLGVARLGVTAKFKDVRMGFPYPCNTYLDSSVFADGVNRFWMKMDDVEYEKHVWGPVFGLRVSARFCESSSVDFWWSYSGGKASDLGGKEFTSVSNPCSVNRSFVRDGYIDTAHMTNVQSLEKNLSGSVDVKMWSFGLSYSRSF